MSSYEAFKSALKGDLVIPSDKDYEKAIARWANNAARRAKIVVYVKDVEDTSLAVNYARAEKLPIAIRGGGHNVAGASSSENGLVIDLSRYINRVRIDAEKKLGYVGGGAVWETVDKTAIEHGLATVGGTVNHTGVGGLTLGGGYGWLSGDHGLAVDNVVQVTMVVRDGSILIANKDVNSDLFWAVRGSGCNFGVCVEFVYQLHEQRRTVYSGTLVYPAHLLEPLIKITSDWWEKGPSGKEGLLQIMTRGPPPESQPCIVCFPFFNGSEEDGRDAFKAFLDLKPFDHTSEIPYENLNAAQNAIAVPGQNVYMKGVTQSSMRPEIAADIFQKVTELTSDASFQLAVVFEYFPLDKINSVPNDAMAFNNRSKEKNILSTCSWGDHTPENQSIGRDKVYAITDLIANFEEDEEAAKTRAYGNYADETVTSGNSAKLFGSNYRKLQELKKKYDPDVIFTKWFPITPA
ncbi:FAD-binding domain-containing protein [Phellopilus nigrolimitatus]|nr:FAD-binding domain-containing protein [Phellopilus nigrolimitatus]